MSLMGFRKRTMGEQDKLLIRLQTLHYCDCMLSNNTSAHTDGTNRACRQHPNDDFLNFNLKP